MMVATHKDYCFPSEPYYLPVQVGKALSKSDFGVVGDDTGDNISHLNPYFCELTGLYWLWKNQKSEYFGLSHYRRYFKAINDKNLLVMGVPIATDVDLLDLMDTYDVLAAKKRCYFFDTVFNHYKYSHYVSDLRELRIIVSELYPDYSIAFNEVLNQRCLSLFNMFVMNSDFFQQYNEWLFSLLFELEKRISYSNYGVYQRRVFGFLSERLFNVWLTYHSRSLKIKLLPVVHIEGEHFISKLMGLLKRKLLSHKPP